MTIKAAQPLVELGADRPAFVLNHPAQRAMLSTIEQLITQLRVCESASHLFEFQQDLFACVYEVEERRGQCSRALKRLKQGKSADASPPAFGTPGDTESWELEGYIFERLARQLRTVGDGLAWRCFDYDRRVILTLSRNAPPGPMYGKKGLPYELGTIQQLWKDDRHFALHHDLTNCLRIADLTEFAPQGRRLREVKATPHTERKQMERIEAAITALMHGGVLPNSGTDARLVELDQHYVTNLDQLNDLLHLARRHGSRGMKLPQGRSALASYLPTVIGRYGHDDEDIEEGLRVMESARRRAIKRAGIDTATHHIVGRSGDTASRSEIMAPWSIYPFSPADCASIICDFLIFETTVSADALAASLERAGLRAEVQLPRSHSQVNGAMPVVRARLGTRALTFHGQGLGQLLYELAEPDMLAHGMRELLLAGDPPLEPAVVYADEASRWLPRIIGASPLVVTLRAAFLPSPRRHA